MAPCAILVLPAGDCMAWIPLRGIRETLLIPLVFGGLGPVGGLGRITDRSPPRNRLRETPG